MTLGNGKAEADVEASGKTTPATSDEQELARYMEVLPAIIRDALR